MTTDGSEAQMKESWLLRLANRLRVKRRALAHRPAWFEAAYLASPERILFAAPRIDRSFSDREKVAVWQKGRPILGWDPEDWRVDHRGDPIFRHHYGDAQSAFGWEVGTIGPDAGEDLANLCPQRCQPAERSPFERALGADDFAQ
jgi:hypothetical protein